MERKEKIIPPQPHQMIMQDRQQLEITGVSDVDTFDTNTVVADTSLGELTIRGSGLHIRQLDLGAGSLSVEGRVDSLTYAQSRRDGGFFARLFR